MKKKTVAVALLIIQVLSTTTFLTVSAKAATETEIEEAITRGAAYLAASQYPDGSWGQPDYAIAITALALVKLQRRAYELGYKSPFDPAYPYSGNVTAGWKVIFGHDEAGNPFFAQKQPLSLQNHTGGTSGTVDNPDMNGNSYGICFKILEVYTTGICLMALEASGTPDRPNDGGIDYNGDGFADTFKQIAQDAADWLSWAQGDSGNDEGGWGYVTLDNQMANDWTDNSNSGYAVLGLAAAEGFGCSVPAWVRTELNVWITTIQDSVNGEPNDGGSYYNPDGLPWYPSCNELKGGNLMFQMTFYGDEPTVQRFKDAMAYIVRHWQDMNNDPGWGFGVAPSNYQAMFCLMKGFEYGGIELIDLDGDGTSERDWYDEFSTILIDQQRADSSWYMGGYVNDPVIDTAWALLTLEKIAPPPVIKVYVDIKPGSWLNPINIISKGVFAVAICGTEDFDVMTIDPATVKIYIEGTEEGVPSIRWTYEDVATPYTGEPGGGHALGGDGYLDLVLDFDTRAAVTTLGLAGHARETIPLIIRGKLYEAAGGSPIQGQDYVRVLLLLPRTRLRETLP